MPPKKFWSNKTKNGKRSTQARKKRTHKHHDDRASARLAIEELTMNHSIQPSPSMSFGSRNEPKIGQASTRTSSQNGSPWHDPFRSYLYPPTKLNFRPPFDPDGSHLARKSPGLTEYEGESVEILPSMMAPGHDQQQRNQQPLHYRPHQTQGPNSQRHNNNPNGIPINGEQIQRSQNARDPDTERDQTPRRNNVASIANGPVPSHIQVAKPYVFQQAIEGCLKDVGVAQAREDNIRLAGVQWIDNVRRALKLPVRTFDTAVVYYHKFRLVHSDGEYSFVDAAAAALFAACKIEDTLKKSRDILCAAHNLKVPRNEQLSPDDTIFEHHSRSIIGLERLMLEASSFDFRNRHPQTLMIKLAKHYKLGSPRSSPIVKTAYAVSLDLYRTFAPLKQSTITLAFACIELAARLHEETASEDQRIQAIIHGDDYTRWGITRGEVMETMLDLLEVYTHYRTLTTVGPEHPIETFLNVRIPLNEELTNFNIPRFTEYVDTGRSHADPAGYAVTVNGVSAAITSANESNNRHDNSNKTSPTSPSGSGSAAGTTTAKANGTRQKAGERGREGTVRFMLNPDRERQERLVVAEYYPPNQRQPNIQIQAQTPSQPHSHSGPPPYGPSSAGHVPAHNQNHGQENRSGPPMSRRPNSSDRNDRAGPGFGPGPAADDARHNDRDRDRDRERERDRERDRDRDRDRDREARPPPMRRQRQE